MKLDKMDALIVSWKDEIIEKVKPWIAIPSVQAERSSANAPFGLEVRRMLDQFLKDASEMGFTTDDVDGYAGSAQMGEGQRTMGILAHLDIVPAGDGWTHDPFEATLKDGNLYGRGIADDKGPALAALYAMRAVREAGIPLKDAVRLIVGCDEETGMSDMHYYAKARRMPDYGFSPDAEFPLINIEKGGLALRLSAVTDGETDARIPVYTLYAGIRQNVVPGAAFAEVGVQKVSVSEIKQALAPLSDADPRYRFTVSDIGGGRAKIEAFGEQGHAAMPEKGFNAAGALLIALAKLEAGGGSRKPIEALAHLLGVAYDGEALGIKQADALSGPLTCNLGILRYDGSVLTAQLDIRYPLCADETSLCGNAVLSASAYGLSVLRTGGHTPLHVPAESDVVQGLLGVYKELTGQTDAKPLAIGGGTYSRTMPNTVAFGICFPGEVDTCHMPDEHVDVEKFMLSIRIMAHAIARLAG